MSKVTTIKFRVAFPQLFTAKLNDLNGKDEFSVVALFPKGANLKKMKTAAQEVMIKKFGADTKKWPCEPNKMRSPFRDQGDREKLDEETGKMVLPQGYVKGATYITFRSTQKPGVVDEDVEPIIDQSLFYGGCWAIATVNAYAYENKGNRGCSFGLGNIQKVADGDAFGNRTKPQDDFEPVSNPDADTDGGETESTDDLFS